MRINQKNQKCVKKTVSVKYRGGGARRQKSPATCQLGGGSGQNCVLRTQHGFVSLLSAPGTETDDDKYMLLVSLVYGGWGLQESLLVCLALVEGWAPPRTLKSSGRSRQQARVPRHLLLNKGEELVSAIGSHQRTRM